MAATVDPIVAVAGSTMWTIWETEGVRWYPMDGSRLIYVNGLGSARRNDQNQCQEQEKRKRVTGGELIGERAEGVPIYAAHKVERRLFAPKPHHQRAITDLESSLDRPCWPSRSPGEEKKAPIESCGGTVDYHNVPSGPAESDGAKRWRTHRPGTRWCHGQGTRFEDRVKGASFLESKMTGTLACIPAGWSSDMGFEDHV